jgi:hypothetical protein
MGLGALDPLEGSLLILPGSGLVALGAFLARSRPGVLRYWLTVFALVAFGVLALFILSAAGGLGGRHGHSPWWGLLILPYPVGWIMALAGASIGLSRRLAAKPAPARP